MANMKLKSMAQYTRKNIDNAQVSYSGHFSKITVMRVKDVLAEVGDFISAVNGYLDGAWCQVGVLRCEYNKALCDSPIAVFIDGKVSWFSACRIGDFSEYVVRNISERLNLTENEWLAIRGLISEEHAAYADCMPKNWTWTCGDGGEISFYEELQPRGKLAINITNYYEHTVVFDENSEYGVTLSEFSGGDRADEYTEFSALSA